MVVFLRIVEQISCNNKTVLVCFRKTENNKDCLFTFSLSNLVSLELRENMLHQLPASMSFLVKLESLDLGSNEIEELVSTGS